MGEDTPNEVCSVYGSSKFWTPPFLCIAGYVRPTPQSVYDKCLCREGVIIYSVTMMLTGGKTGYARKERVIISSEAMMIIGDKSGYAWGHYLQIYNNTGIKCSLDLDVTIALEMSESMPAHAIFV